jgi:hypothetical protein
MAATDKNATNELAAKRRERTPITGTRALLEVRGKESGYHYAWINDKDVPLRQDNGFEHVRHPVQVGARRLDVGKVGTDQFICVNVGQGVIAYLMRIPQEFYDEDMLDAQRVVDEKTTAQIANLTKDGLSGDKAKVDIKSGLFRDSSSDQKVS